MKSRIYFLSTIFSMIMLMLFIVFDFMHSDILYAFGTTPDAIDRAVAISNAWLNVVFAFFYIFALILINRAYHNRWIYIIVGFALLLFSKVVMDLHLPMVRADWLNAGASQMQHFYRHHLSWLFALSLLFAAICIIKGKSVSKTRSVFQNLKLAAAFFLTFTFRLFFYLPQMIRCMQYMNWHMEEGWILLIQMTAGVLWAVFTAISLLLNYLNIAEQNKAALTIRQQANEYSAGGKSPD